MKHLKALAEAAKQGGLSFFALPLDGPALYESAKVDLMIRGLREGSTEN